MFAAVVPCQHPFRNTSRARKRQNAFEITRSIGPYRFMRVFLTVIISSVDHLEKVSRRKLLVVTDNNNLFGPCDNAKRVLRGNLTDEYIENKSTGREKLGYRQWAH